MEEASASLGANSWQTFCRVIFPAVFPALLTGFTLAFARGLGEYGSVIFISGNMPMHTEITSLLIVSKLEQYDYAGATAIASVMLVTSFALLMVINGLQARTRKIGGDTMSTSPAASPVRGGESAFVRWTLICVALLFLIIFLVLPLASVFVEAFAKGWQTYLDSIRDPDALSAIRLTLLLPASR